MTCCCPFGELKAQNDTAIRALREERDRSKHERDEYKKLYELVLLELERTRRHLFSHSAVEAVDLVPQRGDTVRRVTYRQRALKSGAESAVALLRVRAFTGRLVAAVRSGLPR